MTAWTCTACTLENANPSGLACELCRTERVFPAVAAATSTCTAAAGPCAPAVQNRAADAVPDAEEDDHYCIDAHHGPLDLHVEDISACTWPMVANEDDLDAFSTSLTSSRPRLWQKSLRGLCGFRGL